MTLEQIRELKFEAEKDIADFISARIKKLEFATGLGVRGICIEQLQHYKPDSVTMAITDLTLDMGLI